MVEDNLKEWMELTQEEFLTEEEVKEIKSWSGYYMVEEGMEEDKPRVEKIKAKLDNLFKKLSEVNK